MKSFDYTSLQQPLTPEVIQQFKTAYPNQDPSVMGTLGYRIMMIVSVFFIVPGLINITLVVTGIIEAIQAFYGGLSLFLGVVFVVSAPIAYKQGQRRLQASVKIARFAAANGLSYEPVYDNPPYAGLIFTIGSGRVASNRVYTTVGEQYEFANYTYTTGSGKSRETHREGYICITLDRELPNMVLDSLDNNPKLLGIHMSNLPISFTKDQILKLEGDFNNHFTLYAPKEYEQDALYVFTPDLMALMIDEVSKFDAEIVDNKLYIYSPTHFALDNQAVLERIFTIINLVGAKTLSQTEHYADAQAGGTAIGAINEIAVNGRRLHRRISWVSMIAGALIVLWIVFNIVRAALNG